MPLLLLLIAGCQVASNVPDAGPDPDLGPSTLDASTNPPDVLYPSGCDPLSPDACGYPFPSNVWTVPDSTTPTGLRLAIPGGLLPTNLGGHGTDTGLLSESDGFSTGAGAVTYIEGATSVGLPDPLHIADSLRTDAPTVLLDTRTGELVPHWSEIDVASDADGTPGALIIRPAVRLDDATRYIAAIRRVVDAEGALIPASPAFRALRDETPFPEDPRLEERRAHYEEIFVTLAGAGVPRQDLVLAWDYTTASEENVTRRLLFIRDQTIADMQQDGCPEYTIDSVEEDVGTYLAIEIEGTVTVPMYLNSREPGGVFEIGSDGLPIRQGTTTYPFVLQIPNSAAAGALPVMEYGHGLFQSRNEAKGPWFRNMADDHGVVLLSMDIVGLASDDKLTVAGIIAGGDLSGFAMVPDGNQQAIVNYVVATEAMRCGIASDPRTFLDGQPTIDPSTFYYFGPSLGGTWGATYMAVTPDIRRGALMVPGQSYDLQLLRSHDFDAFLGVFRLFFDRPKEMPLITNVAQILWDRSEPNGYARRIARDPFPLTPSHDVILIAGLADHSVPNVATHLLARTIGIPQLGPAPVDVWGIEEANGPVSGSVLVQIDWGREAPPITNIPASEGLNPHQLTVVAPEAHEMVFELLTTGSVDNACWGVCDPD